MKLTADIHSDRTIEILVDTGCSDITITNIKIISCDKLNTCDVLYTEQISDNTSYIILTLHENTINTPILDKDVDRLDLLNDFVIVQADLNYTTEYLASCTCDQAPTCLQIGTYYKCRIYDRIMNSLSSVESDCSNLMTSTFVDEVLKKKMIDTCIDAKQFAKACKLWKKFYNKLNIVTNGGCGCDKS